MSAKKQIKYKGAIYVKAEDTDISGSLLALMFATQMIKQGMDPRNSKEVKSFINQVRVKMKDTTFLVRTIPSFMKIANVWARKLLPLNKKEDDTDDSSDEIDSLI